MKTLIGHVAGQGFPSQGKINQRFFPILVNGPHPSSIPWKASAPFTPLRQPMGGHGNPRKEHPAPRSRGL